MPFLRNKKGEVEKNLEKETRPIDRNKAPAPPPVPAGSVMFDDEETAPLPPIAPARLEGKTTVYPGPRGQPKPTPEPSPILTDAMADPVVGWLVVIRGPGQGHALKLGYGQNTIGRGTGEHIRVSVHFGDAEISREAHCVVSYDPRGRKYYLSGGLGTNMTYLNEVPVLAPTELKGAETIVIGQTHLRLVPLCGVDFDWQDFKDS